MMADNAENTLGRISDWASKLTQEQLVKAIIELTHELVIVEQVRFWDDAKCPYWEASGEPIIEGQDPWG